VPAAQRRPDRKGVAPMQTILLCLPRASAAHGDRTVRD